MEYDIFISHASEDKDSFVRPLANALAKQKYKIWYDEHSLKIGDSLSEKIDAGLANSKYGVVVLSKNFFRKEWPKRELRGLVAKETEGQGKILPIWHNIEKSEILKYSPTLADLIAIKSILGVNHVSKEISQIITIQKTPEEGAVTIMNSLLQVLPSRFSVEDANNEFDNLFKENPESLNSPVIINFKSFVISKFRENKTLIEFYDGKALRFHNLMKS